MDKKILLLIIFAVIVLITIISVVVVIIKNKHQYELVEEIGSGTVVKKEKNKTIKKDVVNENGLVNYNVYEMDKKEKLTWTLVGMGIVFVAAYIFYQSFIWAGVFSLIGIKFPDIKKKDIISKRKEKLLLQFKEALYAISTSLSAGKSVENAFSDAKADLESVFDYGKENYIIDELTYINRRLQMNQTIEEALEDFAERSDLEDIKTFANVFNACKATGGNLKAVTEMTSRTIGEKITIKQDIKTLVSGKKFEANILGVIPFAIILLIQTTSPDFLSTLYTLPGRLIATVALLVIFASVLWARKIMNIEV